MLISIANSLSIILIHDIHIDKPLALLLFTTLPITSYFISKRKIQVEKKSIYLAYHDALTGLPNRRSAIELIELAINDALLENTLCSILFIDLDNFKYINDTFGHNTGDYLLKEISTRFKDFAKDKYDFCRLNGDEFILILSNITEKEQIVTISNEIMNILKKPFTLYNIMIHINCSIGISIFPHNGTSVETLLKNADIAMYKAKEKKDNIYEFFNNDMKNQIEKRLYLEESIRMGLENNEFVVHYQPKIEIKSGKITGMEALVRWNSPEKGLVYPNEFIHIAEESGLIKKIDEYVLKSTCLQIRSWLNKGLNPQNVSVNISAKFLQENTFVTIVKDSLEKTNIDSSYLSIEITESSIINDKKFIYSILNKLKNTGIKILLDDFGKGYSSLSYLKEFPIDVLKIDKLFVSEIHSNKTDATIIKTIIAMAKTLNLKVLVEGVETNNQLQILDNFDCDEYQGYLFSKPLPPEKIEILLSNYNYIENEKLSI